MKAHANDLPGVRLMKAENDHVFGPEPSIADLERGELAAIYELGRTVNVTLSLDRTATAALQGILKAVSPDLAFLFLRYGDRLVLSHLLPQSSPLGLGVIPEHRVGHCMCGLAVSEGRALYSRNIFDDHRCTWDECKQAGLVSFAALPLRNRDEIIGVIGLASAAERDFEQQARFLDTLASQIAVAIANAKLHEALQLELNERTRAEVRLRESEQRFRKVVERAPLAMAIVGVDGAIEFINQKAISVFGYLPEDIPTMERWWLQAYPDDAYRQQVVSGWMSRVQKAVAEDSEIEGDEYRATCKDGTVKTIFISGVHVSGKVFVLFDDISARLRAEAERRELQDQLYQAQKMEAIGRLAGGVAHDFNNILGGILGGLSLLEAGFGEPGAEHPDIQEMKALVWRGADLAKQLLGFARGGKYDVRPLNMVRVLEKTSAMFGRTRKDITIQVDIAPGLPSVLMDHTQLEQVLLNLFLNAGQAMPGGGRLLLRAENANIDGASEEATRGVSTGHFIKLVVTDTGMGMDAATRARIFEPFFTTKPHGKGTGLGLASAYGIINSHGGSIDVESAPGEGATFTLLLPATDRMPSTNSAQEASIQRGKGTILVVDDEKQMLRTCARVLETLGYRALTASGGRQAMEILQQHGAEIDLVMLDMTMPEMNGSQTYDNLKEIAPAVKVLLSSGYSLDEQARDIMARGCNGFIQKPFDVAALSAKLSEII
jgi:two-component system, cell cycle sensor histidine kinase and response regulator CckA